ncbi:MAG: hypothetical protein DI529_11470 [Chryseobacterium sp.]|nr:MAG: hypothetical protein DI529_11470 [Chryseobacterium sp.]
MNEKTIKSHGQLKEFVKLHELQNNHSNIHFNALVSIKTVNSEIIKQKMAVRVNFNVFDKSGQIFLDEHNLEPEFYPTIFYPDYSFMQHIDNNYLQINDIHTRNKLIGEFVVKIYPLDVKK